MGELLARIRAMLRRKENQMIQRQRNLNNKNLSENTK